MVAARVETWGISCSPTWLLARQLEESWVGGLLAWGSGSGEVSGAGEGEGSAVSDRIGVRLGELINELDGWPNPLGVGAWSDLGAASGVVWPAGAEGSGTGD